MLTLKVSNLEDKDVSKFTSFWTWCKYQYQSKISDILAWGIVIAGVMSLVSFWFWTGVFIYQTAIGEPLTPKRIIVILVGIILGLSAIYAMFRIERDDEMGY